MLPSSNTGFSINIPFRILRSFFFVRIIPYKPTPRPAKTLGTFTYFSFRQTKLFFGILDNIKLHCIS